MLRESIFNKIIRVSGNVKRNLLFLMANDLSDRFYEAKDGAVEDIVYEFEENKRLFKNLKLIGREETLRILQCEPKSFVRFGDGEIDIMEGRNTVFQSFNSELSQKLKDILNNKHSNYYVGINQSYFHSPFRYPDRQHRFYRERGTKLRSCFLRECNPDISYLDACCFGAYFRYGDDYDFESYYSDIRNCFKGKNIILVSGAGVFEKLSYDIFDLAASKKIIHGPNIDAFDEYRNILEKVLEVADKDKSFICVILGQTATVLVADLAERGYFAWDVGHLAKDYDVYMRRVEKTKENMNSFWDAD